MIRVRDVYSQGKNLSYQYGEDPKNFSTSRCRPPGQTPPLSVRPPPRSSCRTGSCSRAEPAAEVELLEPGTPAAAVLIASWSGRKAFDEAWDGAVGTSVVGLIAGSQNAVVLAAEGLPLEGLPEQPEVPTVASVPVVVLDTPPTYMAIQGSVTDDERIVSYRDTILPMMKERGSLYVVFCIGGGVRILHGSWNEQIYAISRWPTHASAHDFWYSERYQTVAIPLRTGIGAFHVHLLRGRAASFGGAVIISRSQSRSALLSCGRS